jgi:hypothetical protein
MEAQTWQILSVIEFSLAGIFLFFAIFLFYKLRILSVIGFLNGHTTKKYIKKFNQLNMNSKNNLYKILEDDNKTELI